MLFEENICTCYIIKPNAFKKGKFRTNLLLQLEYFVNMKDG